MKIYLDVLAGYIPLAAIVLSNSMIVYLGEKVVAGAGSVKIIISWHGPQPVLV